MKCRRQPAQLWQLAASSVPQLLPAVYERIVPSVLQRITPEVLTAKIPHVASRLLVLLAFAGDTDAVLKAAETLSTSSTRRVLLLLVIWVAANKAAFESMQALASKQLEIFSNAMKSAQDNLQTLAKGGGMPDSAKQNELARDAFTNAMAQMSEVANAARKAQTEALTQVSKRMTESGQEMRKALQSK